MVEWEKQAQIQSCNYIFCSGKKLSGGLSDFLPSRKYSCSIFFFKFNVQILDEFICIIRLFRQGRSNQQYVRVPDLFINLD